MEGFLDRLANLLKGVFADEGSADAAGRRSANAEPRFNDPDLADAWEELDDYMKTGRDGDASSRPHAGASGAEDARTGSRARRSPDETLRQDYANLEVPFGADFDQVRRSYKRLMLRYHPDKHSASPDEQKLALEITQRVNESFERIRTSEVSRRSH